MKNYVALSVIHLVKVHTLLFFAAVVMCVGSTLLVYWVTRILEEVSEKETGIKSKIKFDISFFLVVAAGASSVMATGFSLLMHCFLHRASRERTRSDDELSLELMYSMLPADSFSDIPPPAYSP